jgi:hypothetical protein
MSSTEDSSMPKRPVGRPRKDSEPKSTAPDPVAVAENLSADASLSEPTDDAAATPRRRKKKSFGLANQKLAYPPRAGYHRHWFNDTPGRISDAQERGYTFVLGPDKKPVSRTVGVREGGGGQTGVLMEIPQDWYDEDKAEMYAEIDDVEQGIISGQTPGGSAPGQDGRYVPSQGISLKVST